MKQRKNSECCKELAKKLPPWAAPPFLFTKITMSFAYSDIPFPWRFPESSSWLELKHKLLEKIPPWYENFIVPKCSFSSDLLKEKLILDNFEERSFVLLKEDLSEGVLIGGINHLEMFKILNPRKLSEEEIETFLRKAIGSASSVGMPLSFSKKWGSLTAEPSTYPTGIKLNMLIHTRSSKAIKEIRTRERKDPRFKMNEIGPALFQIEAGGLELSGLIEFVDRLSELLKENENNISETQTYPIELNEKEYGESLSFGDFLKFLSTLGDGLSRIEWAQAFTFTAPTHSAVIFGRSPDRVRFDFIKSFISRFV